MEQGEGCRLQAAPKCRPMFRHAFSRESMLGHLATKPTSGHTKQVCACDADSLCALVLFQNHGNVSWLEIDSM